MSNDPFTLDMFGSSALSSGLRLGFTAFGEVSPAVNDDEPDPTPPSPSPTRVRLAHRRRPVRRYIHPQAGGYRGRSGKPVRHGKGDRVGRRAANEEGRARGRHRSSGAPARGTRRRPLCGPATDPDAARDIEFSTRRIDEIDLDIERHNPTDGDAFAMSVLGEDYTERKLAGAR